MSEHSEGRIVAHDNNDTVGLYIKEHGYVAVVHVGGQPHFAEAQRANARRLVAAWNACLGLPTDMLANIGHVAIPARMNFQKLTDERDGLVKALRGVMGLVQLIDSGNKEDHSGNHRYVEAVRVSSKYPEAS